MPASILFFLLFISAFSSRAEVPTEDDVYVLDPDNFDDFVNNEDFTVVEFYAPWCGHCKNLAPQYAKAAKALAAENLKLAKVDADKHRSLGERFGVSGFPTIKVFRKGEASDYDGPRDAPGIVKYVKSKAGPASKLLPTADAVQTFVSNLHEPGIVFFGAEDSDLFAEFQKTSAKLRDNFRFGYSHSSEAFGKFGVSSAENKIIFFQPQKFDSKLEKSQVVVEGSTADEIGEFIQSNTLPLAGELTKENMQFYKKKGLPVVVLFTKLEWDRNLRGITYFLNRLRIAAKEHHDKLAFAIAESSDFQAETSSLGFEDKTASLAILDLKTDKKYRIDNTKFSVENMKALISDYLGNKLEPHIKSEPIPTSDDGDVKVVVGKNFDAIVNDPTKDVLLEAYAPWCGHCKTLAPKYSKLATQVKAYSDKLTIAKIDATANDLPSQYSVRGFPSIFFVPANNKDSPLNYEGKREVKDFIKYLKNHATFDFDTDQLKDEL